ncbi:MAG: DNA-binding protein WhiA [Fastidiosipilaceae bacterium]|jgi:DNA-binding protein WhiA|nr:DNA-binding protein WhiA [Clostridiaceae bacterium]
MTFSLQVKEEILQTFINTPSEQHILLGIAFITNGRATKDAVTFSSSHKALCDIITTCFYEELGVKARVNRGKELHTIRVSGTKNRDILARYLTEEYDFSKTQPRLGRTWVDPSYAGDHVAEGHYTSWVRTIQAAFLAGGSIADPSRTYHLELMVRRPAVAVQLEQLFKDSNLPVSTVERYGYSTLYIKEGDFVADFLALTGAHTCRLEFENYRMTRELRNQVNRVVNCDNANSRRIANASARQLELLRGLKASPEWKNLNEDLRFTAELRLENPDLSLRELGELMEPPLGKSGVNHRLKRLEKIYQEAFGE